MAHGDGLPEQSTTKAEREQWDRDRKDSGSILISRDTQETVTVKVRSPGDMTYNAVTLPFDVWERMAIPDACEPPQQSFDMAVEQHRLEVASQLYERFCDDILKNSAQARVRLVAGIQVAIRDAFERAKTPAPRFKYEPLDRSSKRPKNPSTYGR